jgi:hypothetical protein
MKAASFNLVPEIKGLKKYRDIHLWENFITAGYVFHLILSGFNVLLIMCSVYPALIIHKGLINWGSGLSFLDSATDDPTGKTYGFKLFGLKIKRSSTKSRLIFAGLSIVFAFLIMLFGAYLIVSI